MHISELDVGSKKNEFFFLLTIFVKKKKRKKINQSRDDTVETGFRMDSKTLGEEVILGKIHAKSSFSFLKNCAQLYNVYALAKRSRDFLVSMF